MAGMTKDEIMQKKDFWKQVEQRAVENRRIVKSGMPAKLAPAMAMVGLHFWMVGLGLSLAATAWLWGTRYEAIMRMVRVMVWR